MTRSFRRRAQPRCRLWRVSRHSLAAERGLHGRCAAATWSTGRTEFGAYASFPTVTDIPFSATDSFLGLRYSVGDNTFYGFAQFAGGDLERFGFETTPNIGHRRKRGDCDPGTFNLGDDGLGICRDGPPRQTPPIVPPRLTPTAARGGPQPQRSALIPACVGMRSAAHPSISAVTCAATERESPSRS